MLDGRFSALDRFNDFLVNRENKEVSYVAHGNASRSRYSVLLGSIMALTALAPGVASAENDVNSFQSNQLQMIAQQSSPSFENSSENIIPNDLKKEFIKINVARGTNSPSMRISEDGVIKTAASITSIGENQKPANGLICDVSLYNFKDIHKSAFLSMNGFFDQKSYSDYDFKMFDDFIRDHEMTHCATGVFYKKDMQRIDKLVDDTKIKMEDFLDEASIVLPKNDEVMDAIGTVLNESISDSNAVLHRARYMLIQDGKTINDFNNFVDEIIKRRSVEFDISKEDNRLDAHDTRETLKQMKTLVNNEYEKGEVGLKKIFGLAAYKNATTKQLDDWSDRSYKIAEGLSEVVTYETSQKITESYADLTLKQLISEVSKNERWINDCNESINDYKKLLVEMTPEQINIFIKTNPPELLPKPIPEDQKEYLKKEIEKNTRQIEKSKLIIADNELKIERAKKIQDKLSKATINDDDIRRKVESKLDDILNSNASNSNKKQNAKQFEYQ